MDDIRKYMDYRDFLRDHYQINKQTHRFFSLRFIAGKTEIDASYYIKILNKKKHISDRAIPVLIDFLKFDKLEADYFTILVHYNKAKQPDEQLLYLKKLVSLREPPMKTIGKDLYGYFASWWNVALREELNIMAFSGDFNDLAARFQPDVTVSQVKRAFGFLQKMGLIQEDSAGIYSPSESFIESDGTTRPSEVKSFQKEMLGLAITALDRIPKQDRDISTLTVSTTRSCIETIRGRLAELRNEIVDLVKNEEKAEEVYQINFQVFPLTRNIQREKKSK
jgi:uncharacterized protein (TIGR02147 family)